MCRIMYITKEKGSQAFKGAITFHLFVLLVGIISMYPYLASALVNLLPDIHRTLGTFYSFMK